MPSDGGPVGGSVGGASPGRIGSRPSNPLIHRDLNPSRYVAALSLLALLLTPTAQAESQPPAKVLPRAATDDSSRALPDSIDIRPSTDAADSSLAVPASPSDSSAASEAPSMRAPWSPAAVPDLVPPTRALSRADLDHASGGTLREAIERPLDLYRVPSGSYHLPDPIDAGDLPSREPSVMLLDGVPLSKPHQSEMPPDLVGPVWLRGLRHRPVDPLVAPNLATGGSMIEMDLERPDSSHALSGARLTSGGNSSHTEEFFLARPVRSSLVRVFYGDHKTVGRLLYFDEIGDNLRVHYDHRAWWGRYGLAWHRSFARQKVLNERRWVFDRSGFEARVEGNAARIAVELDGALDWNRQAWEGDELGAKRKDSSGQLILRLAGPLLPAKRAESAPDDSTGARGASWSIQPMASAELDRNRLRFWQPEVLSLDREETGLGFAAGIRGGSEKWRMTGVMGRAEPVDGRSGGTGLASVAWVGPRATSTLSLQRGVRPRLMPRLASQLSTQVGQSITAPEVDPDAPLEVVTTAELKSEATIAGVHGEVRLRQVEIEHTISAEGGLLQFFTPAGYEFLPREAFDRTVRVRSVHASCAVPLPFGFGLEGDAALRTSDPGWRDELWMTPFDARGRIYASRRVFNQRLFLLAYLRGAWNGKRATPFKTVDMPDGILPPRDRYDAGLEGSIADARFFFELANLEDDLTEAAGFEGGWMVLPYRSFRMGLVWRFDD